MKKKKSRQRFVWSEVIYDTDYLSDAAGSADAFQKSIANWWCVRVQMKGSERSAASGR